jgi:glucan phosphoethanolaminetransferase (alkaline phosphatase superfamily)
MMLWMSRRNGVNVGNSSFSAGAQDAGSMSVESVETLLHTNHILGSVFIGVAVIVLILTVRMDMPAILFGLATSLVLVGLGVLFIIPWNTSSGPGLTNDDRYQKLLGESAYSCQAGHYDEQNCRAQKQGLDDVAKWLNEQKR